MRCDETRGGGKEKEKGKKKRNEEMGRIREEKRGKEMR